MRSIKITENAGLWAVELSDGRRASGPTLASAMAGLTAVQQGAANVSELMRSIPDRRTSIVLEGQAGG